MGRGRFTEEEMDRLLQNPYVTDVNPVSYTHLELKAPAKIESNSTGSVRALWVQPQIAGEADLSLIHI